MTWTSHGEAYEEAEHDEEQEWLMDGHAEQSDSDEEDDLGEDFDETKEAKANKAVIEGKLAGMVHDENMQELIVKETSTETTARTKATEFATLMNDSTIPLYTRCETEHT